MFKIGDEVEVHSDLMGSAKGPYDNARHAPYYSQLKGKTGIVVKPTCRAVEKGLVSVLIEDEIDSMFPWRLKLLTLEANE